jgi:hypothetical protein
MPTPSTDFVVELHNFLSRARLTTCNTYNFVHWYLEDHEGVYSMRAVLGGVTVSGYTVKLPNPPYEIDPLTKRYFLE